MFFFSVYSYDYENLGTYADAICGLGRYLLKNPKRLEENDFITNIRQLVKTLPTDDDFRILMKAYFSALGLGDCTKDEKDIINKYATGLSFN